MAGGAGPDSSTLVLRVYGDIGASIQDAVALTRSPSQWTDQSLLIGTIAAGAIGGAFAVDDEVRHFVQEPTSAGEKPRYSPLAELRERHCRRWCSGSLYCSGLAFSNDWLTETGRSALTALALTGMVTTMIKVVAGRARPMRTKGRTIFRFSICRRAYGLFRRAMRQLHSRSHRRWPRASIMGMRQFPFTASRQ